MKVICAWCENEGKETLIGEIGLYDLEVTSHGICFDHEKVLLRQIDELKIRQNPRLRRQRRSRATSRSSGSPTMEHCTTPWRRRRTHRMSSVAQLSLPFADNQAPAPLDHEPGFALT
jgi:hypothetical protein